MSQPYDSAPPPGGEKGPLDGFYKDQFIICIILSACPCVSGIGLILALIAFFTAKDPLAKKNAKTCMIVSIAVIAAILLIYCIIFAIGLAGAGAGAVKN
jgi:hypothetical protein